MLGLVRGALDRLPRFLHVLPSALYCVATCARDGQSQNSEQRNKLRPTHDKLHNGCEL